MSQEILDQVRRDYQQILQDPAHSILTGNTDHQTMASTIGYTPEELAQVPQEANLGLGCGNPLRAADLQPGEVVIDLGSGKLPRKTGSGMWNSGWVRLRISRRRTILPMCVCPTASSICLSTKDGSIGKFTGS